MVSPIVVARAEHSLSRRDIDPDALKVLYRLHGAGHVAYLVGGSVRDLLLGRRPKDFDLGTDAHPYQVKRLFRNCWIIGRRFRLAHVKFGTKTIEVATFRTQVVPGTEGEPPLPHDAPRSPVPEGDGLGDPLIHRDNTFGTPEEDAFRRDFTVNALFYDIGTFAIIDYVGGLQDLQDGVIRCIGDPEVRFREDPVRMLRAVVLQARLGFRLDPPVRDAIAALRGEIARSAPARLIEELYKILRSGAAEASFRELAAVGLLEQMVPRIPTPLPEALVASLAALDAYRAGFAEAPATLTNPVLLGTVLAPLGFDARHHRHDGEAAAAAPGGLLGMLPVARRDVERLSYALALVRRLEEVDGPPRARATLVRRHAFPDALTWLEIRGEAPQAVAFWRDQLAEAAPPTAGEEGDEGAPAPDAAGGEDLPRRRRRRRRGRRRPG